MRIRVSFENVPIGSKVYMEKDDITPICVKTEEDIESEEWQDTKVWIDY